MGIGDTQKGLGDVMPDFNGLRDLEMGLRQVTSHKNNPAKWTYERLLKYIRDFENLLDDEHEVGARLVSFGAHIVFHISQIGYYDPDIINFDGIDQDGCAVQLIQNISQLNVLLIAMPKREEKAKRIGFVPETKSIET